MDEREREWRRKWAARCAKLAREAEAQADAASLDNQRGGWALMFELDGKAEAFRELERELYVP